MGTVLQKGERPQGYGASRPIGRVFAAACLLGAAPMARVAGEDAPLPPVRINFFCTETSIHNFSMLKGEFDGYLPRFGKVTFQPFRNRSDFDAKVASERPALFLMSSWHFRQVRDRGRLKPVLVGVLDDKTTQVHGLWARRDGSEGLAGLRGRAIATAGAEDYTRAMLREMGAALDADWAGSLRLLVVPKDLDALMAVNFGAADAAIASEHAAAHLQRINPKQLQGLQERARGGPSPLPILAVAAEDHARLAGLVARLARMGEENEGREKLRMIGIDGLRPPSAEMTEELGR